MGLHADSGPTIGDLRATIREKQRRINVALHVLDEAPGPYVRADLIRAALESGQA